MTPATLWARCDLCADAGAVMHIQLDRGSEAIYRHAEVYHTASIAAVPHRYLSLGKAVATEEFAQWCAENMTLVALPTETKP